MEGVAYFGKYFSSVKKNLYESKSNYSMNLKFIQSNCFIKQKFFQFALHRS